MTTLLDPKGQNYPLNYLTFLFLLIWVSLFSPPFIWLSQLIFPDSFQLGYYTVDLKVAIKPNNAWRGGGGRNEIT